MLGGAIQDQQPKPFPSAERIAIAIVWSGLLTDELTTLLNRDEAALAGAIPLQARWYALDALLRLYPQAEAVLLGRLMGCTRPVLGQLHIRRRERWWNADIPDRVIARLACGGEIPDQGAWPADVAAGVCATLTTLIREAAFELGREI